MVASKKNYLNGFKPCVLVITNTAEDDTSPWHSWWLAIVAPSLSSVLKGF